MVRRLVSRRVYRAVAIFTLSALFAVTAFAAPPNDNTTTALSTTSPSTLGGAVTLTATVTDTSSATTQPTGSVQFFDGTKLLGQIGLTGATANTATAPLTLSTLAVGVHSLSATYVPTGAFNASPSPGTFSLTVNPRATTTTVSLAPNTNVPVGSAVAATISVADTAAGTLGTYTPSANVLAETNGRHGAAAALLPDGKVLIAGGTDKNGAVLQTAEVYDPAADSFSALSSQLTVKRTGASATLLNDGTVLVVAGSSDGTTTGLLNTVEIYDPATQTFALGTASLPAGAERMDHSATLLSDGSVLIAGGTGPGGTAVSTTYIYNGSFSPGAGLLAPRSGHSGTLLPSGAVLIAGGDTSGDAELWGSSPALTAGSLKAKRTGHVAVGLPDGTVLLAGGTVSSSPDATAEIYNPATDHFYTVTSMGSARSGATGVLLNTGKVFIAGGDAPNYNTAELYAPAFDPLGAVTVTSDDSKDLGPAPSACSLNVSGTGTTSCNTAPTVTVGEVTDSTSSTTTHTITVQYSVNPSNDSSTGTSTFTAAAGTPIFSNLSHPTITYGTTTTPFSGTILAGAVAPAGQTVNVTVNSVTQPATVQTDGSFTTNFTTNLLGVGPYSITYAFAGTGDFNPANDASQSLTVDPAPLTITASSASSKVYGTSYTVTPSYSGFVNGENASVLTTAPTCTSGGNSPTAPVSGSPYTSSCTGAAAANYAISYATGAVTVTPATLTVTASSNANKPYGTTNTVNPAYSGFVNGETSAVITTAPTCSSGGDAATATVSGGPYTSNCSGAVAANYTFNYVSGSVTVTAVGLTITASSNPAKVYGTSYAVIPSYSGFVNGESASALTTAPTCSSTGSAATAAVNGGAPYATSCAGAVDPNYSISYVAGSIVVTPAGLTITASSNAAKQYGTPYSVTPLYAGFANGENSSALSTQPTCSSGGEPAAAPVNGGTPYPSSCSGAAAANYTISYVAGAITVAPAPLLITASSNPAKMYGTANNVTANFSGFVNGENSSVLTTAPACSSGGDAATAAVTGGTPYASACSGAAADNYAISYVTGDVVVTPAPLTISASSDPAKVYGSTFVVTPSFSGFVNSESASVLSSQPTCVSLGAAATATVNNGGPTYSSDCTGASAGNYAISYTPGVVTVIPAQARGLVTVTAAPATSGATYTLDAIVCPQVGGMPTGKVTFMDSVAGALGTGTLTTHATASPYCGGAVGYSTASYTTTAGQLTGGLTTTNHTLTAVYDQSDANFATAPVQIGSTLTISGNAGLSLGSSQSVVTLAIPQPTGNPTPVAIAGLTCTVSNASGVVAGSKCTVSADANHLPANLSITIVNSALQIGSVAPGPRPQRANPLSTLWLGIPAVVFLPLAMPLAIDRKRAHRKLLAWLALGMIVLLLVVAVGCGGSGFQNPTNTRLVSTVTTGLQPGSYVVAVNYVDGNNTTQTLVIVPLNVTP